MTLPAKYGESRGGYKLLERTKLELVLGGGGLRLDIPSDKIEDNESPESLNIRSENGLLEPGYDTVALGANAADPIVHYGVLAAPGSDGTSVRLTQAVASTTIKAQEWNGAAWGALSSLVAVANLQHFNSTSMQGYMVISAWNTYLDATIAQLMKYNGGALTALSGDAPKALFIAPFGNRLVAAGISDGVLADRNMLKWSADGNIQDWTTAALGAGSAILLPEYSTTSPDAITGLSSIPAGLLIFRQNSVMLAARTGVGSQPFRFTTILSGVGTSYNSSIANAGSNVGVFFFGTDRSVYLVSPSGSVTKIGSYVFPEMEQAFQFAGTIIASAIEPYTGSYFLVFANTPSATYVFNTDIYLRTGKMLWVKFSFTPTVVGSGAVNQFGFGAFGKTALLASSSLTTLRVDKATTNSGNFSHSWVTKLLGNADREVLLDRVYINCDIGTGATLTVELSVDGGVTWTDSKAITPASVIGGVAVIWFNKVVTRWQLKLTWSIGTNAIKVRKITFEIEPRAKVAR